MDDEKGSRAMGSGVIEKKKRPIPPDEERCIALKKVKLPDGSYKYKPDGTVAKRRCKNRRMVGLTVCYTHGGANKAAQKKSANARALTTMQKFVKPISAQDPEANPVAAFEMEFRRTLGRIRWYDEQLSLLPTEKDLIWGRTKRESKNATEFSGVDTTFEARANILHELQFRERQHLLAMEKIWLASKFESAKLDIQRAYVMQLDKALTGILTALGHDPSDPGVRQVVRDQLLALPMREKE